VVRVGTSKGSTISLWLQYIRGISYQGPTERKKERKAGFFDFSIRENWLQRATGKYAVLHRCKVCPAAICIGT
jgi:hypothetical protein